MAPKQKRKKELELISYDELLGSSSMTGLVSFLEIRPKQEASLPQATVAEPSILDNLVSSEPAEIELDDNDHITQLVEQEGVSSSLPDSSLTPASNLPPSSKLHPDSSLLPASSLLPGLRASNVWSMPKRKPSRVQTESSFLPDSNLLPFQPTITEREPEHSGSSLPPDTTLLPDSDLVPTDLPSSKQEPGRNLLSGADLLTANGRTVRVRIARSVQDAHTSAEHMLLMAMWKKGRAETEETKLLRVGLGELSRWTGSHKTSCRAYIRALIAKLALEEAETFDAAAGSEGARVYRIFSFNRILERRKLANFTHVIRTGAVSFVDPKTGEKLASGSNLPSGSNQQPGSNFPSESKFPSEAGSNHPQTPSSNQRTLNKNREETIEQTTATAVYDALVTYGAVDNAALTKLVRTCRAQAPDCTDGEIVHFIHEKGMLTKARESRIQNPIGFLIEAVPKCFAGQSFKQYRQARESRQAEESAMAGQQIPTISEQIQSLERLLEVLPDHPQNDELRRRLAELRQRR